MSRAALSAPGRVIRDSDIEFLHPQATVTADVPPRVPHLAEAERAHIVRVLEAPPGTRRKRPGFSTSAAARSTERLSNTGSNPKLDCPDPTDN